MNKLKSSKKNINQYFILTSIGYIIIGTLLLVFTNLPNSISLSQICSVIGAIILVLGLISIALFLIKKSYLVSGKFGFMTGMILTPIGLYAIFVSEDFARILTILIGFCIIIDSAFKMHLSFTLLQNNIKTWWSLIIAGLVTCILGCLILFNPFGDNGIRDKYTYIVLIADGIINLIIMLFLSWEIKRHNKKTA